MSETTTADQEAVVASVISALRKSFGDRACAVAEGQVQAATADAFDTWSDILARLRSDQDRRE